MDQTFVDPFFASWENWDSKTKTHNLNFFGGISSQTSFQWLEQDSTRFDDLRKNTPTFGTYFYVDPFCDQDTICKHISILNSKYFCTALPEIGSEYNLELVCTNYEFRR